MFVRSKIALRIICLFIVLQVATAWLPPRRCEQNFRSNDVFAAVRQHAPEVGNITEMADNQNKKLRETYKNSKFFGVPISGTGGGCIGCNYKKRAASSCTFHTYKPSLLSSVYCQDDLNCKLAHTVQTTQQYAAMEGYNWGVKVSSKISFEKVFEIGGEASTGGQYSCTYTHTRTVTDNVECTVADGDGKTLQLHSIRSDMECQFGDIEMVPDVRNDQYADFAPDNYFTLAERKETENHALVRSANGMVLPDLDRMSDYLLNKLTTQFPYYNPLTDMVALWHPPGNSSVTYYKQGDVFAGPRRIIPFSNEAGDSIFQYACILT